MSLPLPLFISTHIHTRACHPSDQSPVGGADPGRIMDTIYPIQSQHRASPQLPPPSNSSALSSSRPLSANEPQKNASGPVTVLAVPSVTVENDRLIIGDAGTCQFDVRTTNKFHMLTPSSSPALFSIYTLLRSSQTHRRRIVRNRVAICLVWHLASQYTLTRHAAWPGRASRVCQQTTSSHQEDEEAIRRRLGRV